MIHLNPRFAGPTTLAAWRGPERRTTTGRSKISRRRCRLQPKYAWPYWQRGNAWKKKGDYAKALADFDEAVRLDPALAGAHNSRAWLLGTCPDAKYRDGKAAVESAKKACERTDWKVANYLRTLAAACAEAGQFDDAVAWEEKAMRDLEPSQADEARRAPSSTVRRNPSGRSRAAEGRGEGTASADRGHPRYRAGQFSVRCRPSPDSVYFLSYKATKRGDMGRECSFGRRGHGIGACCDSDD